MDQEYHVIITKNAIGKYFESLALDQIIQANINQDNLIYQLGNHPHHHFDNNKISESLAYIESEHELILELATKENTGEVQRGAFGRLCHAAQDFYAHSNYVDLWLKENGGLDNNKPSDIDGLDKKLLTHPDLFTGDFVFWRDIIYYIPIINSFARKIYVPKYSHEAINLDSPSKGIKFEYALIAAQQRTYFEYSCVINSLAKEFGNNELAKFHCNNP